MTFTSTLTNFKLESANLVLQEVKYIGPLLNNFAHWTRHPKPYKERFMSAGLGVLKNNEAKVLTLVNNPSVMID